jgi:beta-galactosidase
MAADLSRSVGGGRPWLLLERSTSGVNWQPRGIAKRPGEMARNSLAHIARGSDGAMFFQWRASRAGAEKFHSAMPPHAGTDSRIWREVVRLGAELGTLRSVRGTPPPAPTRGSRRAMTSRGTWRWYAAPASTVTTSS